MKKITKRIAAVILMIMITLSAGCAMPPFAEDAQAEPDYTTGTPWLCSFLDGNVTADTPVPDLADDFYLACCKTELQEMQIPEGYSSYGMQDAMEMQCDDDIMRLFTSDTKAESHDAQLALDLYSLCMDWDSRNERGVVPLKELTDAVEAIDSLDALTEYLSKTPPEEQLHSLFTCRHCVDIDDASVNILTVEPTALILDDAAEYQKLTSLGQVKKNANTACVTKLLGKLGYTEEEAGTKIQNCLAFEAELASAMIPAEDMRKPDYIKRVNNHYTREELLEAQGQVPVIAAFESSAGYPEADIYLLQEPDWLMKL